MSQHNPQFLSINISANSRRGIFTFIFPQIFEWFDNYNDIPVTLRLNNRLLQIARYYWINVPLVHSITGWYLIHRRKFCTSISLEFLWYQPKSGRVSKSLVGNEYYLPNTLSVLYWTWVQINFDSNRKL